MKKRSKGGILALIGYLLSPLSWWNDLIVNLPLAYLFAIPFGALSRKLFMPAMIIGYWLTNLLGLVLLHNGIKGMIREANRYGKKELLLDIITSIAYSLVVIILIVLGVIRFPTDY